MDSSFSYLVLFLSLKRKPTSIQVSVNTEQCEISILDDSTTVDEDQIAVYCSLSYVAQLSIASKGKEDQSTTIVGNSM